MEILAISDIEVLELRDEFDPTRFIGIDLILACGDLQPEYLTLVREKVDAPLYYILGNHDLRHQQSPPVGCTDLSLKTAGECGIKLLGLPGSRCYNGGVHQYRETQMRLLIWKLYFAIWKQRGVDIVFTHASPRHVHDAEDCCHRGFKCFHRLIKRFQPSYFLHGHIHAHFNDDRDRITRINNTQVINCCGYYVFKTEFI